MSCSATEADGTQGTVIKCENKALGKTKYVELDSYTCTDYKVAGKWVPQQQITSRMEYQYTKGTIYSQTHTKQETWSDSVTTSAEAGIEVEGIGMSQSMSETQSYELAIKDEEFWSTETTTSWTYTYTDEFNGHVSHQWIYTTTDPWGKTTTTWTPNVAITNPGGYTPKCIPYYIAPWSTLDSQTCCAGGCLPFHDQDDESCNADCGGESATAGFSKSSTEWRIGSDLVQMTPSSDGNRMLRSKRASN